VLLGTGKHGRYPANPFTFVDGAGHWHIRVLEKTNGIVQW